MPPRLPKFYPYLVRSSTMADEKDIVETGTKSPDASSKHSGSVQHFDTLGNSTYAKLVNPLQGIPQDELMKNAAGFARTYGLEHLTAEFQKGALVAQDPGAFESLPQLTEEDKIVLRRETTHRWDQPVTLYYLVIMCSLAAAVQGVGVLHISLRI